MRRTFLYLLLALLLTVAALPAQAQGTASVRLSAVDPAAFPRIRFHLDVFDASGAFVTGLLPQDLTVREAGVARPVDALTDLQPGLQLVLAVNPAPPLDIRDSQGVSRYDKVLRHLLAWADSRPADTADDLSLTATSGVVIEHAALPAWREALVAFRPSFRQATPGLRALAEALDAAADPLPSVGRKRVVLFITPHMEQDALTGLQALLQRALDSDVRVIVWLVDSTSYFQHSSAAVFQALAVRTGGAYFAFSGSELLPDPELYFEPLRHRYQVEYTSALTTSGEHELLVEVNTPAGPLTSTPAVLRVEVLPPNPILVSPPAQIVRRPPEEDPYNVSALAPSTRALEIIIEFPDGHPRPLVSTALYVDGVRVAENLSEPFDRFTWDLSGYLESGTHTLQVEAVDSLGLSRLSLPLPVDVTVVRPVGGVPGLVIRNRVALTLGAILLAGAALMLILFSRGRLRQAREARRRERALYRDPVTRPVQPAPAPAGRSLLPARGRLPSAPAYLFRVRPDGQPASGQPIPLIEREITFGYDPVRAMHVLDDPSVSDLHARLIQAGDGSFVLRDEGSVAGTWVNYEPVNGPGRRLQHGDLIHFGRMAYRFTLRKPPARGDPRVTPL